MPKTKSDGGSASYYDLPKHALDIGDLIEHRNMSFNVGNIFKACYRLDAKEGVDAEYDLNKIIYFANRELNVIRRRKEQEKAKAKKPHRQGPIDQTHVWWEISKEKIS